jgi:hypothetical protein
MLKKIAMAGGDVFVQNRAADITEHGLKGAGDVLIGVGKGVGRVGEDVFKSVGPKLNKLMENPETAWIIPSIGGVLTIGALGAILAAKRRRDSEERRSIPLANG